jgi:phosphatidylserine decarboxylase
MSFRPEVIPFIIVSIVIGAVIALICGGLSVPWAKAAVIGGIIGGLLSLYMLYFFRDPYREPSQDPELILSGADGTIAGIKQVREDKYLKTDCYRISIFLSLFDVHVNRTPIEGTVRSLGYFPGKRYFTFEEKSSEFNQHSEIFIEGANTKCLVNQIVGPVARRVVYWLEVGQALKKGQDIGMMKFGSRLDMYLPVSDVDVIIKEGDKVAAGLTVIARLKEKK